MVGRRSLLLLVVALGFTANAEEGDPEAVILVRKVRPPHAC
jgi:hypothetical protein